MNEKKRLIKNTLLITIGNFGTKVISFLLLPLYTSLLSTSEYGIFDFIVALSAFLLPIVTFSIHESLFRFIIDIDIDKDKDKNRFKSIVSNAVITIILGLLILFIVLLFIYFVIKESNKYIIFYLFLYVTANVLYTFSNNLLRGLGKIKEYAIISCLKNILQLIINILVIVVFRFGIKGLLISACISESLAFIIVYIYSKLWIYIDFSIISKKELSKMLKYSIPLIPNALCNQIINISDRFIITSFMNSSYNGIYSISYKFPNMVETVYHYFYTAWSESASRIIQNGKEKAIEFYQSLYKSLNNIIFSTIIVLISLMPLLFRMFIRGNYAEGFKYIPILMISMYFDCIAKFYSGIFTAFKETKSIATTTMIAAFFNVVINILFIKRIGLYAAAISTLVAEIILVIIRKNKLKKYIKINIPIKDIIIMIFISLLVIGLYDYSNWYMIAISISISLLYSIYTNRNIVISISRYIKNKLLKKRNDN